MTEQAEEILSFWFGEIADNRTYTKGRGPFWFKRDSEKDALIKEKYEPLLNDAVNGNLKRWEDEPRSLLALIILIDQFSRNIYRDSPKAYENDALGLELARKCVKAGYDTQLHSVERHFVYLAFAHSEDLNVQKESMQLFDNLVAETEGELKGAMESYREFAKKHYEVIAKFGRYPHRNQVLGRKSTDEETSHLEQHPGF